MEKKYTPSRAIQKELAELQKEHKRFQQLNFYEQEGEIKLTYKEICKITGEKEVTGNARYSQIKKWKRFIDLEKIKGSQKYLIKEVYKNPLPKESKQNSLYTKVIELLLMYELSEKEDYTAQYTKTNLYNILGMVNDNFLHKNRENALETATNQDKSFEEIKSWEMNHFYLMTTSKLNEILTSALKSMRRRCILDFQEIMMISLPTEDGFKTYSREATDEEWEKVLEVQKEVLLKHGWDKIPLIQAGLFYEEVNEELFKRYEWAGAYKEIKLIYTKEYIKGDIPTVLNEIKDIVHVHQSKLNTQILKALETQAYRLKEKNSVKIKEQLGGIGKRRIGKEEYDKLEDFLYPNSYISHQKKLMDLFIRIEGGEQINEKSNE